MLANHLKLAIRNLRRQKFYAALNIVGLAIGLACAIVVALFVAGELSYDRFHAKADRIHRITYDESDSPSGRHLATVSPPMGLALVDTYPEIVQSVRLRDSGREVFSHGERRFYEADFFYADSTFFDVFSFPLAKGDSKTALSDVNTVVVSQSTAERYFGDEDPIGGTLRMNDEVDLTVTGVLGPPPGKSHLQFDFLISFSTFRVPFGYPVTLDDWGWISFHTYVLLAEGAEASRVEAKLPAFVETHFDERRAEVARLRLQPVTDIYLGRPKHPEMAAGSRAYLYGLSGAGILMLLLACFNFANLSTVQSIRRSKEVGMRKALGAQRGELIRQYLSESVLTALFALVLALLLAELGLAAGNRWLDLQVAYSTVDALPAFIGIAILTGLLAGCYPAVVLSGYRPVHVFKGGSPSGLRGGKVRDGLVVLQFAIAIVLVAGTAVIAKQMDYVGSMDLGFDEEGVIALHMPGDALLARYDLIEQQLSKNPHVVSVTKSDNMFDGEQGSVPIYAEGAGEEDVQAMPIYSMYFDFFETMGIEIVEGRGPSRAVATDSAAAIVINQKAADVLAAAVPGWDQPLGKSLRVFDIVEGRVIGIAENFHFASLHAGIEPLILYFPRTATDKVLVRVAPGDARTILASLERDWQAVAPDFPFTYRFLDEHIEAMYHTDRRFSRLLGLFAALTVLVACMGLYGLTAFAARLRAREISIRKVLGASVPSVVAMLSRRMMIFGMMANVIAWPLAYVGIRGWLDNFAYHIEPGIGVFAAAGMATVGVALVTVSYESFRAALANPAESLRQE